MSAVFSRGAMFSSQAYFEPDAAFDLIEQHRPTVLYPLFPTITLTLMHHPRFANVDCSNVRFLCSVSPPDTQRAIQATIEPALLVSAYGMTELAGTLSYNALSDSYEQRTSTCGRPLPGWEIEIRDPETDERVGPDVRGELVARGPALFSEYFASPDLTAASFDEQGFFHTGDHCSVDADGLLSFHGRLKDMLKVGGENVSALEVESFLATHPAVKLAQVVGMPDPRLLEVGVAFVELVPGQTTTEEELIAYCTGRMASFKIPRRVRFVEEWPMSSTKIQKFRLKEQILAELQPAE
jgi:fatty-acyl-CoA synthase